MGNPKILLTSITKPLGLDNPNIQAELFHSQLTRSQDIFSIRSINNAYQLDLIALNLANQVTTMQYPDDSELKDELKKGYDYLGINFVVATWPIVKKIIKYAREISPQIKIVLGGYGSRTADFNDELGAEVKSLADYVCAGDGVEFMRNLLGQPQTLPYKLPLTVNTTSVMSLKIGRNGVIFSGLGCERGCDFCSTSHFYKRRFLPFLNTGTDIFNEMRRYDKVLPERVYTVLDEDLLRNKKRVEELHSCIITEPENPRTFFCFGAAQSVLQYDPDWLAELGIDSVWIGIESEVANYEKNRGIDMSALFKSLHNSGVNTIASMIFGLDEHTKENIEKDLLYQLSLEPSLSQYIILSPCPVTPLWESLKKQGRLLVDKPVDKCDGFHLYFKHKNFTSEELEKFQEKAYTKEYEILGASVFRYTEKALIGFRRFRNSSKEIMRSRSRLHFQTLVKCLPLINVGIRNSPAQAVKERLAHLRSEILGELKFADKCKALMRSWVIPFFEYYTKITGNHKKIWQPETLIKKYNIEQCQCKC